jgi:hypothetical protein
MKTRFKSLGPRKGLLKTIGIAFLKSKGVEIQISVLIRFLKEKQSSPQMRPILGSFREKIIPVVK